MKKSLILSISCISAILIILTLLVIQPVFVSADDNSTITNVIKNADTSTTDQLSSALANLQCKNDLMINTINVAGDDFLNQYVSKLNNDYSQLSSFVSSDDTKSYRSYLTNTYDVDYVAARKAVESWRLTSFKNMSIADRKNLKDLFQTALANFTQCHKNTLKNLGDGRVTAFNAILDSYQQKADNLKSKGLDTSTLDQIVSDARNQIVTPLQSALSSASDGQSIRTALKSYCLFNGCANGTNFHLAAKFAIASLNIAIGKIGNTSSDTDLSAAIDDINAANTALTSVGTNKYLPDQEQSVWNNIQSARQSIRKYLSMILGSTNGGGK